MARTQMTQDVRTHTVFSHDLPEALRETAQWLEKYKPANIWSVVTEITVSTQTEYVSYSVTVYYKNG